MRRFLRHLIRFAMLPAALLLACEVVLVGSGEAWSIDRVLAFQRQHPNALFLRALDQAFYAFKYRAVTVHRPSVLVVGSSRTMKFRAGMFGDRASEFFNAGGMVNSLRDLRAFCGSFLPDRPPALLIAGIDLWWLNERFSPVYDFEREIQRFGPWTFDEHVVGLRWLLLRPTTLLNELASLATRRMPVALGLGAREGRGGFRPDGSFQTGLRVPPDGGWTFVDRESPPIIERLRTGTANFVPTDHLSASRIAELTAALDDLERRHVLVVGYLPPFSTEVYDGLTGDKRFAAFFQEFRREVEDIFRQRGFPVVDLSDIRAAGMDDRAMSDGFHGEETIHARAVKRMLEDARVHAALPGSAAALQHALDSPRTNFWQVDLDR